MSVFLGTHQNRLDAKGRVSIPAGFRAILRSQAAEAQPGDSLLVLRQSHKHPCVEAWPTPAFLALGPSLNQLDMFSDDQEDMALSLYGDAFPVDPDKEGRIMLPEALTAHAGLTESVAFMGLGRHFQIWEPAAAERRRVDARARARGVTLPNAGLAS
jgi:MraZ protein